MDLWVYVGTESRRWTITKKKKKKRVVNVLAALVLDKIFIAKSNREGGTRQELKITLLSPAHYSRVSIRRRIILIPLFFLTYVDNGGRSKHQALYLNTFSLHTVTSCSDTHPWSERNLVSGHFFVAETNVVFIFLSHPLITACDR